MNSLMKRYEDRLCGIGGVQLVGLVERKLLDIPVEKVFVFLQLVFCSSESSQLFGFAALNISVYLSIIVNLQL